MSGILYGALLPRDVVLGLDNSTREPTCHSSPYLGQFMLLRKLAEPFSDLLLGAILSKLCSGCIRKALSFNFPNLWKLAAWEWIERISRENCAHGYRCNFLLASSDLFWAADHAFQGVCKSRPSLRSLEWAVHRLWSALRDNVMDRPACFFISRWAVKEENTSTCQPRVHAESRSIWISRNRMLQRWKNRYGSTYQTGIRLKQSNLIWMVIKAKLHYE